MFFRRLFALSLFVLVLPNVAAAQQYATKVIEGWQVNVNVALPLADNSPYQEVMALLQAKLHDAVVALPQDAINELKRVPIWLELSDTSDTKDPVMTYFPSVDVMQKYHLHEGKARAIEITNAQNFLNTSKSTNSSLVLTALMWAYHDRVLGFGNQRVIVGFQKAATSKIYDNVLNASGQMGKSAAMQSERNYFAALSLAYFDVATYYPFVRAELYVADPASYKLIRQLWGLEPN